ncbi:hypothetical protein [Gelidibacter salicanalis]|uniref:Cytochrome C n=1 Tax=Gelidibacter salicanalis TaxID=291193 RepID=A0A934NI97_9FLAO|nr:hypothetical protein [Gelidibacter salicanalis]MBJ7881836.1 hypothetical protein [Gelidibacter salicanalis]
MRQIFLMLLTVGFFSCNQQKDHTKALQNRIDSLEIKLADTYKPGFGDFMGSIQAHHSKLWFAGQNENWKLADFEVHELLETIEDIEKFQSDRTETALLSMIIPPLDSINKSIQQKNAALFKTSYTSLTNACNTCHQAVEMEFNVVTIPETSPYTNQDFKPID